MKASGTAPEGDAPIHGHPTSIPGTFVNTATSPLVAITSGDRPAR